MFPVGAASKRLWAFLGGLGVLLALDRIAKWVAIMQWSSRPLEILPSIRLEFLLNPGVALSIPVGGTAALVVSMLLLFAFLIILVRTLKHKEERNALALVSVLVGAGSNLADRILYGGVVDYLGIWRLPVINLADLLIVGGILALVFVRSSPHPTPSSLPGGSDGDGEREGRTG